MFPCSVPPTFGPVPHTKSPGFRGETPKLLVYRSPGELPKDVRHMVRSIEDARRQQRAGGGGGGRTPPHDLQAEESLLGAMLLSRDAVSVALEQCDTADFYKPAHGHVFEAIGALYTRGEPVDPVTVADELRRAGLLDLIGGPEVLIRLQASTPATSNAGRYARIVNDHALLRRLIGVATDIADMGYDVPENVDEAIDRAESLVFDVGQRRVAETLAPIRDLLSESLDRLEALYDRGEAITGVPTGYTDIDEQLSGLQPSNLVIVGGRPACGKTAFSLGIVAHAAMEAREPVLFFSLEMSHLEITQRLLCAEAKVDSSRMRNGKLHDSDWSKISHAIGRLGEAPIYIDDNPNLTVMDIRAKARRLKSREGLSLVVIDYLQLMTGRQAENRQVEVSEISRGLKILARELEVPVIALSQLSRNLEQRADKRPMLADLRESGCMPADTRVLRADTGVETTMGELLLSGETDIPVWSVDQDLRMTPALMTHVFPTGIKEVFELKLRSGRTVKASANHPFLTIDGWFRLDELRTGDRIAVPRRIPEPAAPTPMAESEVILLAHLLGDGCMVARQPLHYTSADEENLRAVEHAAVHFGVVPRRVRQKSWTHVYLPAPYRLTHGRRNPIAAWLDGLGVYGLHSWDKFIPKAVCQLPNHQLALFIRHLWSTDGSVCAGDRRRIYYASTSRQLIDDLQQLLLRFEIQSHIYTAKKPGYRVGYHLAITAAENEDRFLDLIGVHGKRGVQAAALLGSHSKHKYTDSVPVSVWDQIRAALASQGRSMHRLRQDIGARSQIARAAPSRESLRRIGLALADENLLRLANSEVSWDEIVSITSLGDQPVFDATVRETHNFIANGIVSENSLEQDADVVMFLYRDEVYNAESPDRGTAEIIVAKHRNGPTGTARLAFLDHYARFANMARSV